jgi:hypothetical protein
MRNRFKDLEKRLASLEKRSSPPRAPGLIWVESLEAAKRASLKPGQRIVKDLSLDAAGKTVMTRERITGKPSDLGKRFPDGTWDSTYLDECWADPLQPIRITWNHAGCPD